MIQMAFKCISERMNEYLKGIYNTPEEMVIVSAIGQSQGVDLSEINNKVVLSLLNIERETAMGIGAGYNRMSSDLVRESKPPWHLNLTFIVASVFSEKQYLQSLKVLSNVLLFFQSQNVFTCSSSEQMGKSNWKMTVEPVNLNYQELTNVWSVLGGRYYPSMAGKIRMLSIDSTEISSVKRVNKETKLDLLKDE